MLRCRNKFTTWNWTDQESEADPVFPFDINIVWGQDFCHDANMVPSRDRIGKLLNKYLRVQHTDVPVDIPSPSCCCISHSIDPRPTLTGISQTRHLDRPQVGSWRLWHAPSWSAVHEIRAVEAWSKWNYGYSHRCCQWRQPRMQGGSGTTCKQ